MIRDIWSTIEWKEWRIPGKKQKRLFPNYRKDNAFKRALRDKYLKDWEYAAHWVDSALKTAFSIMRSWKKNYNKGKRKRRCPIVKRPFVRVKQTLMKREGERLRITIKATRVRLYRFIKALFQVKRSDWRAHIDTDAYLLTNRGGSEREWRV